MRTRNSVNDYVYDPLILDSGRNEKYQFYDSVYFFWFFSFYCFFLQIKRVLRSLHAHPIFDGKFCTDGTIFRVFTSKIKKNFKMFTFAKFKKMFGSQKNYTFIFETWNHHSYNIVLISIICIWHLISRVYVINFGLFVDVKAFENGVNGKYLFVSIQTLYFSDLVDH